MPTELLPVGHLTAQQRVRWGPRNSSCPRPNPPYNCEHPLTETTTQCDYPLNENPTQCDYPLNETTTQCVKPLTETTLYAPRWIQMRSWFTSQNWSSCQNGNLLEEKNDIPPFCPSRVLWLVRIGYSWVVACNDDAIPGIICTETWDSFCYLNN